MKPSAIGSATTIAAACCFGFAVPSRAEPDPIAQELQASPEDAYLETLLARMTLAEKIGQLVQRMGGRSKALNSLLGPEELEKVRRGEVGSYLHVAGAAPLRELQRVAVEESRLGIPLLFSMDVVHGYRTIFPVPLAMAASWDPSAAELHARIAAREASAAGIHWTFAPMVDVARDPRWGRVVEGAGEDAYLGSRMAEAQVRGFQGSNLSAPDTILAATKHFGAYGAAEGGRDYAGAEVGERTMQEVFLAPFRAAANAGTGSFMTAFNAVDGVPTTANAGLLRTMLRDQWDWRGVLLSDWQAVAELTRHGVAGSRTAAARLALRAGIDMDMVAEVYADDLEAAIAADPALMPLLDEAVLRLLRVKRDLGLFDAPYKYHDTAREAETMLSAENRSAARMVAERSIVLLKNKAEVLPLVSRDKRIALVGALADDARSAQGSWRARGADEDVVTLRSALQSAYPNVSYSPGLDPRSDDTVGISEAIGNAMAADAIVLAIGEDYDLSGEARSRSSLELPGRQLELFEAMAATGKPLVVVLMGGRPLAIPEVAVKADAILETWLLGDESGPAIVDVLSGKANPGGKLPASFPRTTGQVPVNYDHLPSGRPADPENSKDTARYKDIAITPLYAFGHGLSYTTFEYGDVELSRPSMAAQGGAIRIGIPVTNSGRWTGDEVVQLYIRDPVASVSRPVQQLRGFRRLTLAPGQTKRVTFTLSAPQVALWAQGGGWVVEPGEIEVMIGSASDDIRARASFTVTGQAAGTIAPAAIPTVTTIE